MVTLSTPTLAPSPPSGRSHQMPHLEKPIHPFYLTTSPSMRLSIASIIHARHPYPMSRPLHRRSPPSRSARLFYPHGVPSVLFQQPPALEDSEISFSISKPQGAQSRRCPPWRDRHSTRTLRLLYPNHPYSAGLRPINITPSPRPSMKTTLLHSARPR